MLWLLAPPRGRRLTGGFLANEYLTGHPLIGHGEISSPVDLLSHVVQTESPALIDSICLFDETLQTATRRVCESRPSVLLAHSLPSLIPGPSVAWRREAFAREQDLLGRFRGAVAPSDFMKEALARRGMPGKRVKVVPLAPVCDGRDTSRQSGAPDRSGTPLHIGTVANWIPSKGLLELADVLSNLPDVEWRWTVAGSKPEANPATEGTLTAIRSTLGNGLADRFSHLGPVPPSRLHDLYGSLDLFVLLSTMESYGLAFAEAISHGMPVVGLKVAAIPEVVGEAGILIPAGSRPQTIASHIRSVSDPDRLSGMRRRAEARSSTLPTESAAATAVYQAVVDITTEGKRS